MCVQIRTNTAVLFGTYAFGFAVAVAVGACYLLWLKNKINALPLFVLLSFVSVLKMARDAYVVTEHSIHISTVSIWCRSQKECLSHTYHTDSQPASHIPFSVLFTYFVGLLLCVAYKRFFLFPYKKFAHSTHGYGNTDTFCVHVRVCITCILSGNVARLRININAYRIENFEKSKKIKPPLESINALNTESITTANGAFLYFLRILFRHFHFTMHSPKNYISFFFVQVFFSTVNKCKPSVSIAFILRKFLS